MRRQRSMLRVLDQEPEFGAVALFGDVLAVGASGDAVKDVIDVVQGRAPSAEENERLQEFREIQKEEFLVWGYADLGSNVGHLRAGSGSGPRVREQLRVGARRPE